ncbi:MAG: hypothetical protein H6R11_877 [Proteobacteria bacterium]|nr:hypothetical protein [Pseudomonadota bacterium]
MKVTKLMGALLVCASGFMVQQVHAAAWQLVAGQGARYFVAVDPAQQANEAVFREAAASVCGAVKACVVLFWADVRLAATRMPLTAPQQDALAAQYTRNAATGHAELLFKCRGGAPAGKRCLK